MVSRTCFRPLKSYANYPTHTPPGQTRFNATLNLPNSHLSQRSLRNRWQLARTLDTPCFREHIARIPRYFFPVSTVLRSLQTRRPTMPYFLHQVSYTPEALARLIANPQDRFEAVRAPIEKLGGKVQNSYFAFGQYDAVLITEMPDNVSAAAIALAFAAGGSRRNTQTTAVAASPQSFGAVRKTATCGPRPVAAPPPAPTRPPKS